MAGIVKTGALIQAGKEAIIPDVVDAGGSVEHKSPTGRPPGVMSSRQLDGRDWALEIVQNPEYRENFLERAFSGKLAPQVEVQLLHYAFGKPAETIQIPGGVKLIHLYGSQDEGSLV